MSQLTKLTSLLIMNRRGFSILMAIGTIGVLLIVIVGLSTTYIREMRLSRTTYDEVIAYANAEGMFEYAMLKSRNHREGFADSISYTEPDGTMLVPTSERSRGLQGSYTMRAASIDYEHDLAPAEHLIIPLFASNESVIAGGAYSRNPSYNLGVTKTENLSVDLGDLSWTVVAMSGSESVGLTGSGDIYTSRLGTIRHKTSQCYSRVDGERIDCARVDIAAGDEELQYFYDEEKSISDFLTETSDAYLMVFNDGISTQSVHIESTTPFTLPTLSVRAESRKNNSVQVFQFSEDKSRYYDALKYGVYNNN